MCDPRLPLCAVLLPAREEPLDHRAVLNKKLLREQGRLPRGQVLGGKSPLLLHDEGHDAWRRKIKGESGVAGQDPDRLDSPEHKTRRGPLREGGYEQTIAP